MSEEASAPGKEPDTGMTGAPGAQDDSGIDGGRGDPEAADFSAMEEKLSAVLTDNDRLSREVSELKDQYLRTRADFENTRKRLQRDKEEAILQANKQLLGDLVTVIDDFERALQAGRDGNDPSGFLSGIDMIERQLVGMLEKKWGLSRFVPDGEDFDPSRHEAIAMEPREGMDGHKVLEVYQSGFLLHDKVLRTAKVKVSSAG